MRRLILLGTITFVAGLVLMFPARVAYRWFAPPGIELTGIRGSVWRGAVAEVDLAGAYVGSVDWLFRPAGLFTGKLAWRVSAEPAGGVMSGDIALSPSGRVALANLEGAIAIEALQAFLPMPGIRGNVRIQFSELILEDGYPVAADGTIDVIGLVVTGLSPAPIGDFRAMLGSSDATITGSIEDLGGALDVAGSLRLEPDRSYLLNGLVAPTSEAPQALVDQLRFLGSANERGQRQFRLEGRL